VETDEEKKAFDNKNITEETYMFDKHPDRTNLLVLVKVPLKKLFLMLTMEPKSTKIPPFSFPVFGSHFPSLFR